MRYLLLLPLAFMCSCSLITPALVTEVVEDVAPIAEKMIESEAESLLAPKAPASPTGASGATASK
jgi:hypothetical protein